MSKNKNDRKHMGRVAELGCILCKHLGYGESRAEVHHIRTGTGAGRRAPDSETIPLCPQHHRIGSESLHGCGRKAFEKLHGVTELELLRMTKEALE